MAEEGESAAETMWPLLCGNVPLDEWPPGDNAADEPWRSFVAARTAIRTGQLPGAIALWQGIAAMPEIQARHVLQAWTFLRDHGLTPPDSIATHVLGVVLEIPVEAGRDVLAAYRDRSARYLNHSGKVLVLDDGPLDVMASVDAVIAAAQPLADVVRLWDEPALPELPANHARLVMLTPGGFRFGQGPHGLLQGEPVAEAVFTAATLLLAQLVDLSQA